MLADFPRSKTTILTLFVVWWLLRGSIPDFWLTFSNTLIRRSGDTTMCVIYVYASIFSLSDM